MRERKNVYLLPAGDTTLEWYGRAVTAMKARPPTDPLSWTFQAAVHGRNGATPPQLAPFWSQCQHGTSFFLPWHRMYLLQFERIVAKHVEDLGGPKDWALPYWNYSAKPEWQVLPPAFRGAQLASGEANPLFVARRAASANGGEPIADEDVDLRPTMESPGTTDPGGFFGGAADDHAGRDFGMLEGTVHNSVHVAIGGWSGWMSNPNQAALDPIFWLHHANIDRLWEVWLQRDANNVNLTSAYWRTGVKFPFHDASGAVVEMRTLQVLDTTGLEYTYDDVSDPLAQPGALAPPPAVMTAKPTELVGATTGSVELGASSKHVQVPTPVTPQAFKQAAQPNALVPPGPASKLVQRVLLRLENVTSQALAPVYDVYLNVPDDAPSTHKDRFVGRAAMFGVQQASDPNSLHGGSGQNYTFDITKLYHRLSDANEIDPATLRVSFVPIAADDAEKVSVGRISLYFA